MTRNMLIKVLNLTERYYFSDSTPVIAYNGPRGLDCVGWSVKLYSNSETLIIIDRL